MASSIPPPTALMASVRAMMTKSGSDLESRAALIFTVDSSIGRQYLPARWPHRLGKRWSSIWMPATPVFSNSSTVRVVIMALPYASSASAITGTSMTLVIILAQPLISVIVGKPRSARPR